MAELRGDVDTRVASPEPNYTEIRFDGGVRHKVDIVNGAAKAKGSTTPIPTVTWNGIPVHRKLLPDGLHSVQDMQ